jgi:hypothetical protein
MRKMKKMARVTNTRTGDGERDDEEEEEEETGEAVYGPAVRDPCGGAHPRRRAVCNRCACIMIFRFNATYVKAVLIYSRLSLSMQQIAVRSTTVYAAHFGARNAGSQNRSQSLSDGSPDKITCFYSPFLRHSNHAGHAIIKMLR